ncbi:MAG: DinB family protein [Bacteroidota bacterium]
MMKKFILPVVVLALMSFGISSDTGLTKKERKMAVKEMTNSQKRLFKAIKGLSENQLNFKSSPNAWSVAECVEHITISENMISGMLEGALKTPADPSRRSEVKMPDEKVLAIIKYRSTKAQAPEPFQPSGKFGSYEETVKAFKEKRAAHIKYVKTTKDNLRNHYQQLPFGTIDGFQVLLFMSGHTERHVEQIEEVLAHKDFPAR